MRLEPELFRSAIISDKYWDQQMITHHEKTKLNQNQRNIMFSTEPK